MTDSTKIMLAGCSAGAAAAAIPTVYGIVKAFSRPLEERDRLSVCGNDFVTASGKKVFLRGINISDALPVLLDNGLKIDCGASEIFTALSERFGNYGAEQLFERYSDGLLSDKDIKYISRLGANCVRIPLRSELIFKKTACRGDARFERLDEIVAKCRKNGLYVIFDLHGAYGFQSNDPSCGKADSCRFFDSGKEGFEARNAAVRFWATLAAHYKDEPAVAGYDLINRPLLRVADWESKLDTLYKFYRRAFKAIRGTGDEHIIIMQTPHFVESLPSGGEYVGKNAAFGIYSHFHTTFETDALIKSLKARSNEKIPFIICKIRSEGNWEHSLSSLSDAGVSWIMGDFKSNGISSIFSGISTDADIYSDSYAVLGEKLSAAASTASLTENKELSSALKAQFARCYSIEKSEKKEKIKRSVSFKVGMRVRVGV